MIFFPEKILYEKAEDYGLSAEDVWLEPAKGIKLHSWFLEAKEEKGALLFLHGNAGNISGRLFKAKGWVERGFSVLLVDYRGYGQSTGMIQKGTDIVEDAKAALSWLTETAHKALSKVILYGESLGTYPSIRLAEAYPAAALILEAPFTSFKDLAHLHYPVIPAFMADAFLREFEFPNHKNIDKIKAPLFLIHGTDDEICPYPMGKKLYEKAPLPKEMMSVPNGRHNDLPMAAGNDYWETPAEFISRYL